ncbi:MAG: glutamate--tRNA ligase [Flavobacteriaceae bacterium]|nr:glutamate--tRNA ligase [Flavobacteriaceae bacterium]
MTNSIRVRFAPSPTGPLHIGGVRTALYNYLYAKKHRGQLVLRIEDTDQKRSVAGAEKYIQSCLSWLGIEPDESPIHKGAFGPYRQSERRDVYKKHIPELVENGLAYYAFDSPESLERHRKDHEKKGKTFAYNWHNRMKLSNSLALGREKTKEKLNNGQPYVVRFLMWDEKESSIYHCPDSIRGNVAVDCKLLDDKILYKSDGMPTYHFANVIDDHLMKISHVIRGEEWLPSLALHLKLYDAFGWTPPIFAHLPLILKPSGKGKLSKRDGDKLGFPVFPIQWEEEIMGYKEEGYLPEAVLNFLALLGWNDGGENEVFSLEELISLFDLERVHHAGARFDPEKNKWFNQQHIQRLSPSDFSGLCKAVIENHGFTINDEKKLKSIGLMIQPRVVLTTELWRELKHFFVGPKSYDEKALQKVWKEKTPSLLLAVADMLSRGGEMSPEKLKSVLTRVAEEAGMGIGALMGPLRVVLVGALSGPDLFSIINTLGAEEVTERIHSALKR